MRKALEGKSLFPLTPSHLTPYGYLYTSIAMSGQICPHMVQPVHSPEFSKRTK